MSGRNHGQSRTPTYLVWKAMRRRCRNSNDKNFTCYGGRGISVCERWQNYFAFLEDMGPRPEGMTIDRIDPNGNYCPENCRWADARTQANNTRKNRRIEFRGEVRTLAQWAAYLDVKYIFLRDRLRLGWSIEDAFLVPKIAACQRGGSKGESNPNAKLKSTDVEKIRARLQEGATPRRLCEEFGISKSTVSSIVRGRSWKNDTDKTRWE